jgi:TPR repeat protein
MITRMLFSIAAVLLLLSVAPPVKADIESAKAAFDKGDYSKAYELYLPLAESGNSWAQYYVGFIKYRGLDGSKDINAAVRFLSAAVGQKNQLAEYLLGIVYLGGGGHKKDEGKAIQLFQSAAAGGMYLAAEQLGKAYLYGIGVKKDGDLAVSWFRKSMDLDPGSPWYFLGYIYLKGFDTIKKNEALGLAILYEAAARGEKSAITELGWYYAHKDQYTAAGKFWKFGAEVGDVRAQALWGSLLYDGKGVEKDDLEGLKWLFFADTQNDKQAKTILDNLDYDLSGNRKSLLEQKIREWETLRDVDFRAVVKNIASGTPGAPLIASTRVRRLDAVLEIPDKKESQLAKLQVANDQSDAGNYSSAFEIYLSLAEEGNAEAMDNLSLMYRTGRGTNRNREESFRWSLRSAEAGSEFGQYTVGFMYQKGLGTPNSDKKAAYWYQKAADVENPEAETRLAYLYFAGRGVEKDVRKALALYLKLAKQGRSEAQYGVGVILINGEDGIPADRKKAVSNYYNAAIQGNKNAQFALAELYIQGKGVKKDAEKAVTYLQMSADQGDSDSLALLGSLTFEGMGTNKDKLLSYVYIKLAANAGSKWAASNIKLLERGLTEEQLSRAGELVLDWKPIDFDLSRYSVAAPQSNVKKIANNQPDAAPTERQNFPSRYVSLNFPQSTYRPDDIAVIIGNADYGKQGKDIPDVTPAYADAAGIKQWLLKAKGVREGNIIHLKDATAAQMIGVFGNRDSHKGKLFNWTKPGKSNIYVYYAGHGAPGENGASALLVPADATADTIGLVGYSLETLYRNLAKIPARSITVILEACFSGASQGGSVIARTSGLHIKPRIPTATGNITVISAGAADQVASWEEDSSHSLFTKYFLTGMSGEADKKPHGNRDGKVNYDELKSYLADSLSYYARRFYGRTQTAQITAR